MLAESWHLHFGEDSLSIMQVAYNLDGEPDIEGWTFRSPLPMLGCKVDNAGSIHPDFEDLRKKDVWKVRRPPEFVLKIRPSNDSYGRVSINTRIVPVQVQILIKWMCFHV